MKSHSSPAPCPGRQNALLELIFGTLPPSAAEELVLHLQACSGCRRYTDELSALSHDLREASATLPQVQASESFHRRVRAQIQSEPGFLPLPRWPQRARVVFTAALAAAACVTFTLVWFQATQSEPASPAPRAHSDVHTIPVEPSSPTWKTYQRAANSSLETLDAILDHQAISRATAAPGPVIYALSRKTVEE
jgi:anti-sigma factor RsiW